MLKVSVEVPNLAALTPMVQSKVEEALAATAHSVEFDIKAAMAEPKTGRLYRRGKRGKIIHQASAPGEAPAIDTTALAASIQTAKLSPLCYEVAAKGAEYAIHLEYGTHKMAARPFMRPALERAKPVLFELVSKALRR